ncbi:hypothetical protein [Vreelandella sp. H-I2]
MSHKTEGNLKDSEQTQKAKQVIDKDTPNVDGDPTQKGSSHEEPTPFRPDENVDNQKDASSRSVPSHNTSGKEAPIQGTQLTKEKQAHKDDINKKADRAAPKGNE